MARLGAFWPNSSTKAGSPLTCSGWPEQHTWRFRQTTWSVVLMTRCRSWETISTPQP
ncbi:hypothetical protein D3C81_2037470 [compost metagenome]